MAAKEDNDANEKCTDAFGSIRLDSGLVVRLEGFLQTPTYVSILEGSLPFINKAVIENLSYAGGQWEDVNCVILDEFSEIPKTLLPGVQCTAHFVCGTPARDKNYMASALTMVWLQPELTAGLSDEITKKIQRVDWSNFATDFDW